MKNLQLSISSIILLLTKITPRTRIINPRLVSTNILLTSETHKKVCQSTIKTANLPKLTNFSSKSRQTTKIYQISNPKEVSLKKQKPTYKNLPKMNYNRLKRDSRYTPIKTPTKVTYKTDSDTVNLLTLGHGTLSQSSGNVYTGSFALYKR